MRAIASQVHRFVLWTWHGCGYLEGYGYHPGSGFMVFLLVLGIVAGADSGIKGAFLGLVVMAVTFGPLYLFGAYDRARSYHKKQNTIITRADGDDRGQGT